MSDQYIFFCCNVGNEKLLKEEIRVFYPELALSYSRKGFLTFKNRGVQYDHNTISQLEATFSTRAGICLGKSNPENLLKSVSDLCEELGIELNKCILHSFSINNDFNLNATEIFQREVNEYSPINKTVINLIALGDKEIWIGIHKVAKNTTNYPNSHYEVDLPAESPSRAYVKIAQTVELLNINFEKKDGWLDFGSAPGGAAHYLLERGCKVWGIDPAKMSSTIFDHSNYTHISSAVQDLSQEDLPFHGISWVHVDININPKQSIKEVLRLCKKYDTRLKGIIFSIKMIKLDHVKNIENFEDHFYDWGFSSVVSRQIPSHKQEYVIIAKK